MGKIADLLNEYGTSLEDMQKLTGQLQPYVEQSEIEAQKPRYFTSKEAKEQFNIDLPGPDYLLKLTPDETREPGYRFSYITPANYEIHDDQTVTTPEGQNLTWDEFLKQLDEQQQTAPVDNQLQQEPFQGPYSGLAEALNQPELPNISPGDIASTSYMPNNLPITPDQYLTKVNQQRQDEYDQIRSIFGKVFPQQDIQQLLQFASADPQGFGEEIAKIGRNTDTEMLLRKMFPGITDDQLDQIFYVPDPAEQAARKVLDTTFSDINPADFSTWLQNNQDEFLRRIQQTGQNPDTEAFIKFLMPDATQEDIDSLFANYNNIDKINSTIAYLDNMFSLPNVRAGKLDVKDSDAVARAMISMGLKFKTGSAVADWRLGILTPEQKKQIAQIYLQDPNKSNIFTSMVASLNQAASKNILIGLITSPFTATATPIAKQLSGQEVKPIEWAVGAANLALLFAGPIGGAIGKAAGGIAGRAVSGAINAAGAGVFTTDTVMNWNEMSTGNKIFSVLMDTLAAYGGLKALRPDFSLKGAIKGDPFGNKARQAILDAFNKNPKINGITPQLQQAMDDIFRGIDTHDASLIRQGGQSLEDVGSKISAEDGGSVLVQKGKLFADSAEQIAESKPDFGAVPRTPDGELPIGTRVIDYGNGAEQFTIIRYEMDAEGKWVAIGKNDSGVEQYLSGDMDPVNNPFPERKTKFDMRLPEQTSTKPNEPQMAPGTSVQTGLPGLGPEAAQSKMFDEANTAAGQGGTKQPLTEVPKNKPLEGQTTLPETPAPETQNKPQYNSQPRKVSDLTDEELITELNKLRKRYEGITDEQLSNVGSGDLLLLDEIQRELDRRGIQLPSTNPPVTNPAENIPENIPASTAKPDFSLANFQNTLKAMLDDFKAERESFANRKYGRTEAQDKQYYTDRYEYLNQSIPILEEINKEPAKYYPVLKTEYPNLYQAIKDYGMEIGTIPNKQNAHVLEQAEIDQLRQIQKQYKLPESLIQKIEQASAKGDFRTLEQLRQKAHDKEMRDLDDFLDNLINPPDVYPSQLDKTGDLIPTNPEIDITTIDTRVETKYGKLPDDFPESVYEIEGADDLANNLYDHNLTPKELDGFLSKLNPADQKKVISLIESILGDESGDLIETYRYESIPEGQAFEKYMDSILAITEKYRKKLKLPKIVDLKYGVLKSELKTGPGEKLNYPLDEIKVDPQRFQFKGNVDVKTGTTAKLQEAKWNPKLANLVYGWMDKDGQVWIVNGHHRLDLARRSGAKTIRIQIDKETDGVTAEKARANGALMNIADDQGTPVDVAKFLKDSGLGIDYLKNFGISVNGRLASRGIALSQLDDSLFQKVINGQLDEDSAVAIGSGLPGDFANQREVAKLATSKDLTPKELAALIKEAKYAGSTKVTQATLFGETVEEKSLLLARAKLRAWIEDELARDRRLFGFVTGKGRPEALSKGGTRVDVAKGTELAQQSATAQTIFEAKVNAVGPINDIINDAATKIVQGGDFNAIKREALDQIRDTIASGRSRGPSANPANAAGTPLQRPGLPETAKTTPAEKVPEQPTQPAQPTLITQIEKSIDQNIQAIQKGDISSLDKQIEQLQKKVQPQVKPPEVSPTKTAGISPESTAKARTALGKNKMGATKGKLTPEPKSPPIEAKGTSPEQVMQDWQNLPKANPAPEPTPESTFQSAHAGIVGDMQKLYKNLESQITSYKEALKGMKGDEAKAARLTIQLMQKELANVQRILQSAGEKAKLATPRNNMLKRMIATQVWYKGISTSQFIEIKKRVTGLSSLTEMTEPQLQKVLDAVTKTRPVKIKGKVVITQTTEDALQALNKSLIDKGKITPTTLSELQRYLKLPTDRYISGRLFISETEGRQLLNALNQESEIGLIETQDKINQALKGSPNLKGAINDLTARMYSGSGKGKVGGNPWIDFGKEMYRIQKHTRSKIGDLWRMAYDKNLENGVALSNMDKDLEATVSSFQAIARDKDALQRINDYIASKNKWSDVPYPEKITPDEIKLAQKIEQQFMQFQNDVRYHRFYDAYYEFNGDPQLIVTKIKDAPIEDLREAVKIYETKGANALADYLKTKTWGIIESGYEPHLIVNPKLQLNKIKAAVVGKGRLKSREGVEFDEADRNILQRRETYIKQMLALNLEPYFKAIDREFQKISQQLKDPDGIARGIDIAIRELKGYPLEEMPAKWIMRTQGYAFSTLALAPHMTFRNILQVLLQPNIQSLLKIFKRHLTETEQRFFDAFVSQETGITKDYLMQEAIGTDRLSRFVRKLSYYGKAETLINRSATFRSSLFKAEEALNAYRKTGNIKDFVSHSGLTELPIEDQKNILDLLAQKTVDYGIDGLKAVDSGQAAIMQIARKITEKTHFIYQRSGRARIEMGTSGRTIFSLFTYPRNIVARIIEDITKIKNGTPAEKLNTARNFTSFIAACFIADYIYQKVTGKDQAQYNPITVLSYQPGGLAIGVMQDIGAAVNDLYSVATGDKTARARAITDITRLGDMFIPFYRSTMDILEAATNEKSIDKEGLNWIRSQFDQRYKFDPHANDVERKWYEALQHAFFGGGDIPLSPEETIKQKISKLGTPLDNVGPLSINQPSIYGMKQLYSDLTGQDFNELKKSGPLAADRIKAGFNKTEMDNLPGVKLYNINTDPAKGDTYKEYYRQWQARSALTDPDKIAEFDKAYPDAQKGNLTRRQYDLLEQYNALDEKGKKLFLKDHPELSQDPQTEWLKTHPEENARLAIWGQAKILTRAAYDKALNMIKELDIPDSAVKGYLPPADIAKAYFDYQETINKYGSSSPEAKLMLAQDDKLRDYLSINPITTPVAALEIQVKDRELNDQYADLTDAAAREAFLKDNPEYTKDLRRIDAYDKGLPDNMVDTYADYYTQDFKDYEDEWYLQEHPDFYRAMVDKEIWKEKDFSKVPTRAVWEKYQYYETLPTSGTDRYDYRLQNKDLDNWMVLAKGLKPAKPRDLPTPVPASPKKTSIPKTTPPKTPIVSKTPSTSTTKTTTTRNKSSLQDKAKEAQALLTAIENMQLK